MFARPGPFVTQRLWHRRSGTEHPIAGSLPAVNLSRPVRRGGRDGTELFALALAELEALAGALLPVLLAFLHARIARQEPVLAQTGA